MVCITVVVPGVVLISSSSVVVVVVVFASMFLCGSGHFPSWTTLCYSTETI